jgi:DNA-directed RNA polymerase subunit RPC12/RpoP
MSKKEGKTIFEGSSKCPWCNKKILQKVVRKTLTPGVKAETTLECFIEQDTQSTLEKDYNASFEPEKKRGRPKQKISDHGRFNL